MAGLEVAILDYGAGNVASVAKAFNHLGADARLTSSAAELAAARAIVVPGVGHFSRTASIGPDLRTAIRAAIDRRVPVLGICLGLHWLSAGSSEAPDVRGIGVFRGACEPLHAAGSIKVPHVGWNSLEHTGRASRLLGGIDNASFAYFCHSYALAEAPDTTAISRHGQAVSAVVERHNVFGAQFHPEKSGAVGLRLLQNFLGIVAETR
ncbi:MAG TPA: imidazole glycerol phosphate synthase subunit HisH [Vicinamibacterales bacterium]|nr:imidazole glycerol phosphate synthase subunit HisH [Vicinamibacterales bacterium]